MKRVTRNNLLKLVDKMKQYEDKKDTILLNEINEFIDNVINKDSSYYKKLQSYNFDNETLKYLM
ncbi:MAG: hypothetical protein J6D47_17205 [Peptostreptococcaceae bacterium]|nr:hypothetical protein [Peptostreptococcaceae bacterium]